MTSPASATTQVLVLEIVHPTARDAVVELLVSEVGLIVAHARMLVACAPLPCARGEAAWIGALAERLRAAGAAVEDHAVADHGPCAAHARLPAATSCGRCRRSRCLLCTRLGRSATCRDCVDRSERNRITAAIESDGSRFAQEPSAR